MSHRARSNSGLAKSNRSTVPWIRARHPSRLGMIRTQLCTAATISNATVYPGRCFVAKQARSVSVSVVPSQASIKPNCLTDIGEFLTEEIKGPATFSCKSGAGCKFEEPAMNQLINDIFGDSSITMNCDSGECLHYTQVPGYQVSDDLDRQASL